MDCLMTKVTISGNIDSTLKVQLEELSSISDQSSEALLELAIAEYVARQKHKIQAIEDAVEEADQGVFISDKAMTEWLDSWGGDNEKPAPEPDIFLK